jgi:hypothetical protein
MLIELKEAFLFAEWLDTNCARNGNHEWRWRGDNYKKIYTTEDMYYKYIEINK